MTSVPTVYITKGVLRTMTEEMLTFPDHETAWTIYGLLLPDDTVAITGVIRPFRTDVARMVGTVRLGGGVQVSAMEWLHDNFDCMRQKRMIPEGMEFSALFKGHSHHQLGYPVYSPEDERDILQAVRGDGLRVAIGPLGLLKISNPRIHKPITDTGIAVSQTSRVHFKFYYLTQQMIEMGQTRPILVEPTIMEDYEVAQYSPPLAWPFVYPDYFYSEVEAFEHYGCDVTYTHILLEEKPPMSIQILVTKPTWKGVLKITTSWDFPRKWPDIDVIPLSDKQPPFARLPGLWHRSKRFVDVAKTLEAYGRL